VSLAFAMAVQDSSPREAETALQQAFCAYSNASSLFGGPRMQRSPQPGFESSTKSSLRWFHFVKLNSFEANDMNVFQWPSSINLGSLLGVGGHPIWL
jgi:hypothetical protein